MGDPRSGFEYLKEYSLEETPYFSPYKYFNGKYLALFSAVSTAWAANPFETNPTPVISPVTNQGGNFNINQVGNFWFGIFNNQDGSGEILYCSSDLINWTLVDDSLNPYTYQSKNYRQVNYNSDTGIYWTHVEISELESNNLLATGQVTKNFIYTSNPASTWIDLGNPMQPMNDAVNISSTGLLAPAGFLYDDSSFGSNGNTYFILYSCIWNIENGIDEQGQFIPDEEGSWYYKYKRDIILIQTNLINGTWTKTLLQRSSNRVPYPYTGSSGVVINYSVFPETLAVALAQSDKTPIYSYGAGLWTAQVTDNFTYTSTPMYWSNSTDLTGTWSEITQVGMSLLFSVRYADGIWVVCGIDEELKAFVSVAESLESLERVDFDINVPLYWVEAFYPGDGEWYGYCYPDDEDYWPDYWLIAIAGGIWGISL